MKFGVVVFPGSNCDHDMIYSLKSIHNHDVVEIWHKDVDLQAVDIKNRTKQGALSGATSGLATGAAMGASIASVIPGIGTAIGAGIGALAGLTYGFFHGRHKSKKEAEEAWKQYEKDYANAHAGAVRNADVAAAKALSKLPQQSTLNQFSSMPGQFASNGQINMMPMQGQGIYGPRLPGPG